MSAARRDPRSHAHPREAPPRATPATEPTSPPPPPPDPSLAGLHPPIARPLGDVTTERLALRRPQARDLEALARVFAVREVWQFPYGRGFTRDETQAFLASQLGAWETTGFGLWLAHLGEQGPLIGFVGLSVPTFLPEVLPAVEVGWRLHPAHWGRGYATEGARAALHEAFTTLGLPQVCSIPQSDNPASWAVCERLALHLERPVTIPANARRGSLHARLYTLTRAQWDASTSASHGSARPS